VALRILVSWNQVEIIVPPSLFAATAAPFMSRH